VKKRLFDIQETSEYLGIKKHTLYNWVSQRRIPYVKCGRLTKFDKEQLDKWIESNSVKPVKDKF